MAPSTEQPAPTARTGGPSLGFALGLLVAAGALGAGLAPLNGTLDAGDPDWQPVADAPAPPPPVKEEPGAAGDAPATGEAAAAAEPEAPVADADSPAAEPEAEG